jgi:hypothetical protein
MAQMGTFAIRVSMDIMRQSTVSIAPSLSITARPITTIKLAKHVKIPPFCI